MANCKVCLVIIKKNQLKVQCQNCAQEFHGKCVNISQTDIDFLNEQGSRWRCDSCNSKKRRSIRLEYSEEGLTLETIMNTLKEIQQEQKNTIADFNKSYEVLHSIIEENTNTLKIGMEKIEEYIKEIDQLKSENKVLKSKVTSLEMRVEEMENYSRRNSLEIQGVPEQRDEDVIEVVKGIGKALDVTIDDTMIDACHRVGKKTAERERPRGIIVKFVRRTDKELVMHKRRERKRDFSTRHLGMAMDLPIYVNDSLSPARRKLLGQARKLKRELNYKYIWLRNGNILMRKDDDLPVVEVRTQADLCEL